MDNRQQRRQAAKIRARDVQGHLNTARTAMEEEDFVAAERACHAAIEADPLAAEPHHLLAHIAYGQGRLQNAGDHILEAATRDDGSVESAGGGNIEIHADCGAIMNMLGRPMEAEAACRHVLELKPDHVEAWNNLSVALDTQGKWQDALQACDEALARRPDYIDALINKGSLLVKTDKPVQAIEVLTKAVSLAEDNPLARVNLATALRRVGESDLAWDQCQAAIDLKPDYPEGHGAMGDIHAAAGRFDDALAAYDQALVHRPGFMAVRLNRAAALHKLNRFDEAAADYGSILEDFDESADAHAGLGVVYLATGELELAVKSFRNAVELNPKHGAAWAALASASDTSLPGAPLNEADLQNLKNLSEDPTLSTSNRIAIHFAIADTDDRGGRFEAAFTHFSAGNDARKALMAEQDQIFDAATWMADVSATIAAYPSRERTDANANTNASDDERPVFVIGMPRSGVTLVEQILAAHPKVSSVGEALSIAALAPGLNDGEMVAAVLDRLGANQSDALRIVDKTPFHFCDIGLIRQLFPKAQIIHCRRDALDTGLSCYMQNFVDSYPWSCDLEDIGQYINGYHRLMAHWRATAPSDSPDDFPDGLYELHYENLIADPEPEIRKLIAALGLDWNPACLNFHEHRRPAHSTSNWQARQPLYGSSPGRTANYAAQLGPLRKSLE